MDIQIPVKTPEQFQNARALTAILEWFLHPRTVFAQKTVYPPRLGLPDLFYTGGWEDRGAALRLKSMLRKGEDLAGKLYAVPDISYRTAEL